MLLKYRFSLVKISVPIGTDDYHVWLPKPLNQYPAILTFSTKNARAQNLGTEMMVEQRIVETTQTESPLSVVFAPRNSFLLPSYLQRRINILRKQMGFAHVLQMNNCVGLLSKAISISIVNKKEVFLNQNEWRELIAKYKYSFSRALTHLTSAICVRKTNQYKLFNHECNMTNNEIAAFISPQQKRGCILNKSSWLRF